MSDQVDLHAGPVGFDCGHLERTLGCGGCDPGAIEFVKDDDGPWRRVGTAVLGETPECNGRCHVGDYPDFDRDCPAHGGEREICPEGCGVQLIDEVHDEQIGYEEQARPVVVTRLACTHEIVTKGRWNA